MTLSRFSLGYITGFPLCRVRNYMKEFVLYPVHNGEWKYVIFLCYFITQCDSLVLTISKPAILMKCYHELNDSTIMCLVQGFLNMLRF